NAKPTHAIRRERLPQPYRLFLPRELLAGETPLAAGNPPARGRPNGPLDLARRIPLSPTAGRISRQPLDRVRHRVVRYSSLSVGPGGTGGRGYRCRPPLTAGGPRPADHDTASELRQTLAAAARHPVLPSPGRRRPP